jgi:hypothetical protein
MNLPPIFIYFFILAGYSKFEERKKKGKTSGPRTDGGEALSTMTFSPLPSPLPLDQTISFP